MRVVLLPVLIVALALAVVGVNLYRFLDSSPGYRSSAHLDFLPDPEVAKALAFGHAGTVSKLRFINSLPYFQHLLDARDDRVAGLRDRRGGFTRLYETLIHMDPRFKPFYLYAATANGGVLDRPHEELYFLLRAVDRWPDDPAIWMYLVGVLETQFDLERRQPEQMEGWLQAWADSVHGQGGERLPWMWLDALARRRATGLSQAAYWGQQYAGADPDSPRGRFLDGMLRRRLAEYGRMRLEDLRLALTADGATIATVADLLIDAALIAAQWQGADIDALPAYRREDGSWELRLDPFGLPWRYDPAEGVFSPGMARMDYERWLGQVNTRLVQAIRRLGRRPASVKGAFEFLQLRPVSLPAGGRLELANGILAVRWEDTDEPQPWSRQELLRAAGFASD